MSRQSPKLANEVFTAEERVVVLSNSGARNDLDPVTHANRLLLISTADVAYSIYLPVATGSGDVYKFLNTVAHTSGSIVINLTHGGTSNVFKGTVKSVTSVSTVVLFSTTTNDIFTLNGSTQGAASAGDYFTFMDTSPNVWTVVDAVLFTSGSQATPFSG